MDSDKDIRMSGIRYATTSRKKILEFLKESDNRTVTAADVAEYMESQSSSVNRTTIYRYLDKLAREGILLKYVSEKGSQSSYQYVQPGRHCSEHLHLKCVKCGKIIHLDCHFMEEISRHILEEHDFSLQCRNSVLYGICRECKEKDSGIL